jgi:iron complex outermembrane recepter protein
LDDIHNTEYYANDIVSFMEDRLFLTGGLRHTISDNKRVNGNTGALVRDDSADSTTFSSGIVYHLNAARTYTLYANANSSFIPEFRTQADGSALKPEEGNQKEVGFRFSLKDDRIQGIVSLYEINQQNVAVGDPNSPGDFLQLDGVDARGVECSLNARMTDRWSVFGGYAYTDARDSTTHVRTQDAPYHSFSAFNSYRFTEGRLKGLTVSLGSIFIGERPIDQRPITSLGGIANAPIWTIPAEWRFDFITRYRMPFKGKVQYDLGLKVQNILDNNQIYKLADTVSLQRQPGRNFTLNRNVRF